jgi:hypothetical protein
MPTYTWLTGGGTTTFPSSATATNVDLTFPAHWTLHRFQLRKIAVNGRSSGTANTSLEPVFMSQVVQFLGGAYGGRTIYSAFKLIPWLTTVFLATAIPAYNAWYGGGDNELGFNQRCAYGGASIASATLRFQWSPYDPSGAYNYVAGISYQFAALYSVP